TQDANALPSLLIASTMSYGFTVLMMKRSILTEKVARRGYHVSREYSVDPLEMVSVGEVVSTEVVTIPASMPVHELLEQYFTGSGLRKHQAYPVVDNAGNLLGVVTRTNLLEEWVAVGLSQPGESHPGRKLIIAYDLIHREPVTAFAWESCRTAAERMAEWGVGRLPVASADDPRKGVGIVTRSDRLKARPRQVEHEGRRERFINLPLPRPQRPGPAAGPEP